MVITRAAKPTKYRIFSSHGSVNRMKILLNSAHSPSYERSPAEQEVRHTITIFRGELAVSNRAFWNDRGGHAACDEHNPPDRSANPTYKISPFCYHSLPSIA